MMLAPLGVDLVELSGGSYEAPAMMGSARDIAEIATMPLMVTGVSAAVRWQNRLSKAE